jgi:RNA polymerase sigma-70 factor (ECF subfamily)
MMELTDEELWEAYNSGANENFKVLFDRHKGKVFNFALRMLRNRADAEDVTSETFLQLFHKRFVDNGRAKLTTWLFTVARNASLTRLRSARHTLSMWFRNDDGTFDEREVEDTGDLPGQEMMRRETSAMVRQAIDKLPLEQKEALILREYSGKDYAEIAEIMGCSLEKVKVLIYRAREHLRESLARVIKGGKP